MESSQFANAADLRIPRNDSGAITPAELDAYTPTMRVSVIIPTFGGQEKLELALAALSAQTYPDELLEVVVVDDGSEPPLRLPELRPANTRLVVNGEGRWGIASAVATAVAASGGEVVLRLDSDVVPAADHVAAHARWHELADYFTVVGKLAFADISSSTLAPERVRASVAGGTPLELFTGCDLSGEWEIALVAESDGLVTDPVRAFTIANGATISFTRAMYDDCGGVDTTIPLGSDTELGYRLAQSGALFIADAQAEAWHLGRSQMKARRQEGKRYRRPFASNRIPALRHLRDVPGRTWEVPYVRAVIEVGGARLEPVRATVNSLLSSSVSDIEVVLVGPWDELSRTRVAPLADSQLDLRLIRETFRGDARVAFSGKAPEPASPVPFRLRLEPGMELRREGLGGMIAHADKHRLGRIETTIATRAGSLTARLDRTSALARAERLRRPGEHLDRLVDELWGAERPAAGAWFAEPLRESTPRSSLPRRAARRLKRLFRLTAGRGA